MGQVFNTLKQQALLEQLVIIFLGPKISVDILNLMQFHEKRIEM